MKSILITAIFILYMAVSLFSMSLMILQLFFIGEIPAPIVILLNIVGFMAMVTQKKALTFFKKNLE